VNALLRAARAVKRSITGTIRELRLPAAARRERQADQAGGLAEVDPGPERIIREGIAWLGRAQDCSTTHDGGVARHYSLIDGWSASYPETTGYIVPTLLEYARHQGGAEAEDARRRARRMLDWFLTIQFPSGAFQGGMVHQQPVVPVTFNTGQILLGLAAGAAEWGEPYLAAMHRAATWLVETQDADGCWRKHPTPFAGPGEKAYETHVAWGLLEAAGVSGEQRYVKAALANIRWALARQQSNGWFADCCLSDRTRPLTHTIGYVLRGVVEAHRRTGEGEFLTAAVRTADALLPVVSPEGRLPGRLDRDWQPTAPYVCLTGSVQIALCWMLLAQATKEERYREAARRVNRFVRRSVKVEGPAETRGAVKGSLPVQEEYGTYQYLNWACKFCVDANLMELL
jgi:hypothetical protein